MTERVSQSSFAGLTAIGIGLIGLIGLIVLLNVAKAKSTDFSGLAMVGGTVDAPKPFKAAKVYFRNSDKRMLYMVYTNGGKYQAMHLVPGNYELSVEAKGLESEVRKLELKAGEKSTANVTLYESTAKDEAQHGVESLPYEQIYPQGTGQRLAERLCIRCHGPNFLPAKQWPAEQWNSAIDFMSGNGNPRGAQIQPSDLSQQERDVLVRYLVENFGPESKPRAVKFELEMPVDETKISRAEYIEYYLAPDPPGTGMYAPEYASAPPTPWGKRRVSQDVVFDDQGDVWVTDRGTPNRIARLDPRTGEFQEFLTPRPTKGIHDLMIDKEGKIWLPEESGPDVDVFDTKSQKWVAAYPKDPDNKIEGMKNAQSLVIDSKHNVHMNFIVGTECRSWTGRPRRRP